MGCKVIAHYRQGALTGGSLQRAIDDVMSGLSTADPEISRLGVNETDLRSARFAVKEEGGFIAEGIILSIAIGASSSITADIAKALWTKILRTVKAECGDDAIGPKQLDEGRRSESG